MTFYAKWKVILKIKNWAEYKRFSDLLDTPYKIKLEYFEIIHLIAVGISSYQINFYSLLSSEICNFQPPPMFYTTQLFILFITFLYMYPIEVSYVSLF